MLFLRKTDETTWKPPFLREPPSPFNQPPISEQFFLTPFLPNFQKRDSHPNIRSGEDGGEETMFTCIRIKLSCSFYPRSPIKSKTGGKILFLKHVKTSFYHQFSV